MTAGQRLPRGEHVSRYCRKKDVKEAGGQVNWQSFRLREGEKFLSFTWLEPLGLCTLDAVMAEAREVFKKDYDPEPQGRFVLLKMADVIAEIKRAGVAMWFEFHPTCTNPTHAELRDYPVDVGIAMLIYEAWKKGTGKEYCGVPAKCRALHTHR